MQINNDLMKVKKTISIDDNLLKWVETKIEAKEYGSLSHAIEKALVKLKADYERHERLEGQRNS
jgi:Arc/MetJ-type ribon-helix-helix transcriptional regulator